MTVDPTAEIVRAPGGAPDRRQMIRGLSGLAAVAACPGAATARTVPSIAPLAKGVNLAHWFAQSYEGYGPKHLASFVTPDDLGRIAAAGFSHVRLGLDPAALFAGDADREHLVEPVLSALRSALDRMTGLGLAVVIDLHPVGAAKNPLLTPAGEQAFLHQWTLLASALAADDRNGLVLEILNEPEPLKAGTWWNLQGRALAAIRASGAKHLVIVNGGGWSGIDDLVAHGAYDDPRVIYTIHHYAPLLFTHQATTWSWDVAGRVAGLGWPLTPDTAEQAAAAATQDEEARGFVRDQIAGGMFTRASQEAQFDRLTRWRAENGGVPIYVGEFGVYTKAAPLAARLAWIRDAREGFERRGWGWALWDNTPSFGFRSMPDLGRAIDPEMLRALGTRSS